MATYYVRKTGNNGNSGTTGSPWLTVTYGLSQLSAGDTLIIGDGTYTEVIYFETNGTAGNHITVQAENKWGAKLTGTPGGDQGVLNITGNYNTWRDLEVLTSGTSVYSFCMKFNNCHHNYVFGVKAHQAGAGGINTAWCDFTWIEDCITYDTSRNSHASGISTYQHRDFSGITGTLDGTHRNIIRNNISYDNVTTNAGGTHTDGNGIIIDDTMQSQDAGYDWEPYDSWTLVENNLCYGNGGKGIQVFFSTKVKVLNNTVYRNNLDEYLIGGEWKAGLSCSFSEDCIWANNISVCKPSGNPEGYENAILCGNSTNIAYYNNLTYNLDSPSDDSVHIEGSTGITSPLSGNGHLLETDPLFVAPGITGTPDFTLQETSPAIDAGTDAYDPFETDLAGNPRIAGAAIDMGPYEYGSEEEEPSEALAGISVGGALLVVGGAIITVT